MANPRPANSMLQTGDHNLFGHHIWHISSQNHSLSVAPSQITLVMAGGNVGQALHQSDPKDPGITLSVTSTSSAAMRGCTEMTSLTP